MPLSTSSPQLTATETNGYDTRAFAGTTTANWASGPGNQGGMGGSGPSGHRLGCFLRLAGLAGTCRPPYQRLRLISLRLHAVEHARGPARLCAVHALDLLAPLHAGDSAGDADLRDLAIS